jgi:hypothetical protein
MTVPPEPMTLLELLATFRGLFYAQHWYANEAFLRTLPNEARPQSPTRVYRRGKVPASSRGLPLAVDLANAYVRDPANSIWDGFLWCRDIDSLGQRVFVGGVAQGRGMQIHRHLHLTSDWGTPLW